MFLCLMAWTLKSFTGTWNIPGRKDATSSTCERLPSNVWIVSLHLDRFPPFSEVFHRCFRSVFKGEVLHARNNVYSGSGDFLGPSFWPVLTSHWILIAELYE